MSRLRHGRRRLGNHLCFMTLKEHLEITIGPDQTGITEQIEEGVHQSKP